MLLIDLDELDLVFQKNPFWSTRGRALCRLNQSDHLKKHLPEPNLKKRVYEELKAHGISASIGSIRLLTQLSYFGFRMNPVSFYYCYSQDGETIEAVIAEVNNTPWGEQHTYLIKGDQRPLDCNGNIRNWRVFKFGIPQSSSLFRLQHLSRRFSATH